MSTTTQKTEKTITFTNAKDFLQILQTVNKICEEIHFFKIDDQIVVRNLSPDHVSLLEIKFNNSEIQYIDIDNNNNEFYLGFKITKKLLNELTKLDLSKGFFITETGIYDYNGNGIKIEPILDQRLQSIPKLKLNKVVLQLSEIREFRNFLELTKKMCSTITFKAESDNKFSISAKTDNFKNDISLVQYLINEIEHIENFEEQTFYCYYIDLLPKMLPKDIEFLNLSFGNKLPLKIEYKINNIVITYFIAPIVRD